MIGIAGPAKPRTDQCVPGTAPALVADANPTRVSLLVNNSGTVTVFIGFGSGVDAGNGFPLAAGQTLILYNPTQVWAVVSAGTGLLGIIEESL